MTIGELLRSQRRWGRTRARKFLFSIALNENRELGRLTARQRAYSSPTKGPGATPPGPSGHHTGSARLRPRGGRAGRPPRSAIPGGPY